MGEGSSNSSVILNMGHWRHTGAAETMCCVNCDTQIADINSFCDTNKKPETETASTTAHFFEGVEKNLEVWFTNAIADKVETADSDLRNIPRCVDRKSSKRKQ